MIHRCAFIPIVITGLLVLAGCAREPVPTPMDRIRAAGEPAARLLVQARQATDQGRYAVALAKVDSLIAFAPDLPQAYYQRGLILEKLYQLEAADAAFERTLALDPYHRAAWYKRGHMAFEQAHYREAIRRYHRQREVILSSPENLRAYHESTDTMVIAQAWLQVGRTYQMLHRADSARQAYQKVLVWDSTHAQAHAWLAELYDEEGRTREALAHARRARRHAPENPDFTYQLGKLLMESGNPEEALPLLESTIEAQPWNAGAHYNLGRVLTALGRAEEGRYHLALTDQLQDLEQKIDQARAGAAEFPNDPARWHFLSNLLGRAGRREEQQQTLAVARTLEQRMAAAEDVQSARTE